MRRFLLIALAFLLMIPTIACAETITLDHGTWIVGEDIPEGHYKLESSSWYAVMCDKIKSNGDADLNESEIVCYLDSKKEAYLPAGMYICIDNGSIKFKEITYSTKQLSNKTFKSLLYSKQQAILYSYENAQQYRCPVYAGTYTVGVDIPEGSWQIRYFDLLSDTITITHNGTKSRIVIYSPDSASYTPDQLTTAYFPLYKGDTVTISGEKGTGAVFFIPYSKSLDDWR